MTIIDGMMDNNTKALVDNIVSLMQSENREVSVSNRVYSELVSPLRGPEKFLETIVEFNAEKVEVEPNKVFIYLDDKPGYDIEVEFGNRARVYVNFKTIEVDGLAVEVKGWHVKLKVQKKLGGEESQRNA